MKRKLAALIVSSMVICSLPMSFSATAAQEQQFFAKNIYFGMTAGEIDGFSVYRGDELLDYSEQIITGDNIVINGINYTAAVTGDVDGDGLINSTDFMQIRRYFLNLFELTGENLIAADVNFDGAVNSTDFMQVRQQFLKLFTIPIYGEVEFVSGLGESVNVTPNIDVTEYLPFVEDSKIVKYDSQTLKLTENLPIIDGATAAFPVYSAMVNAVYPETTTLNDGVFQYTTTTGGYKNLAEKNIDIFFGAGPSQAQKDYAEECGTTFEYTVTGYEAFVFFVHKDNPIESLTVDQIKGIYSGEITNWSEVGGNDEPIVAYQRDEGSGSQTMFTRFMGETPIATPPKDGTIGSMGSIVDRVADFKSNTSSIGFSFRYYLEGIVKNPDIKMIAINGIEPNKENIRNNTYPIVTPSYAVTYAENTNPNVDALIEWILGEEGQYIIEETGYVGIGAGE